MEVTAVMKSVLQIVVIVLAVAAGLAGTAMALYVVGTIFRLVYEIFVAGWRSVGNVKK